MCYDFDAELLHTMYLFCLHVGSTVLKTLLELITFWMTTAYWSFELAFDVCSFEAPVLYIFP